MTEAMEIFASQVAEMHAVDAERLIRAFCEEVTKRAEALHTAPAWSPGYRKTMSTCKGQAYDELKRELLG